MSREAATAKSSSSAIQRWGVVVDADTLETSKSVRLRGAFTFSLMRLEVVQILG